MPDQDKHSRTEKPTARRKKEARREGQVARTPELVTWLVIMSGTYLVQYTVKTTYAFVDKLWYQVGDAISRPSITADISVAEQGGKGVLSCLAPAVLTTMALALLVNLAQTRGLVTFKPLKPSFSHVNPAKGLKRIFLAALAVGGGQADVTSGFADPGGVEDGHRFRARGHRRRAAVVDGHSLDGGDPAR